jgi:arylsulfatase A-like enzyme
MVFLHLSVPHSPNIWSRMDDAYTTKCDSSYLDNLTLADIVLGKLMAELTASPRWPNTTLIVEGDHSWRTEIWDDLPAWTDEDDAASRGIFDTRPALIVHQPGQIAPQTDSSAWSLINVHQLVETTLHKPD